MSRMPGAFSAGPYEGGKKTEVKANNLNGQVSTRVMNITFAAFMTAFQKFKEGAMIQDAFPMLPAMDREFILTGSEEDEWEKMFPPFVSKEDKEQLDWLQKQIQRGIITYDEFINKGIYILSSYEQHAKILNGYAKAMYTARDKALTAMRDANYQLGQDELKIVQDMESYFMRLKVEEDADESEDSDS